MVLTCSSTYKEQCEKMQYLEAERMGNVLETFSDVFFCEVVRTALYRELSDKSLLECLQGESSE
jgi:hypothetical protein